MSIDVSSGLYRAVIVGTPTANRVLLVPDASGTLALLSGDVPPGYINQTGSGPGVAAAPFTPSMQFLTYIKPINVSGSDGSYRFTGNRYGGVPEGAGDYWVVFVEGNNFATQALANLIGIGSYVHANPGTAGGVWGALFHVTTSNTTSNAQGIEIDVVNNTAATAPLLTSIIPAGGALGINILGVVGNPGSLYNSGGIMLQASANGAFRTGIHFGLYGALEYGIDFNELQSATPKAMRLKNTQWIAARNAANGADVNVVRLNASDLIEFGVGLSAPTIADLSNAQHDHLDADDGGTLSGYSTTGALTTHEADTSTHGVGVVVGTSETQTLSGKVISATGTTIPAIIAPAALVDSGTVSTSGTTELTVLTQTLTAPPVAGQIEIHAKMVTTGAGAVAAEQFYFALYFGGAVVDEYLYAVPVNGDRVNVHLMAQKAITTAGSQVIKITCQRISGAGSLTFTTTGLRQKIQWTITPGAGTTA